MLVKYKIIAKNVTAIFHELPCYKVLDGCFYYREAKLQVLATETQ